MSEERIGGTLPDVLLSAAISLRARAAQIVILDSGWKPGTDILAAGARLYGRSCDGGGREGGLRGAGGGYRTSVLGAGREEDMMQARALARRRMPALACSRVTSDSGCSFGCAH